MIRSKYFEEDDYEDFLFISGLRSEWNDAVDALAMCAVILIALRITFGL